MQDLNQLLKTLLSHKLDFLIVDGFAAVVHGSSHVTKDLDITMLMNQLGSFSELKSRSTQVDLFGFSFHVLSLDDLIHVKETMRRPKDLIVLEELKALKNHS